MVAAVLFVDIVDDFLPAFIAEIHVKIRHGNTLRVQKAFEDQVVADRVDIGDADTVGREAPRTRTAPGPDRNAPAFGVVDKIIDNEVIVRIPHFADDPDLIVKPLAQRVGHAAGVTAFKPFAAEGFEVFLVVTAIRRLKIGQLDLAVMKVKLALRGDLVGIFAGFRHH